MPAQACHKCGFDFRSGRKPEPIPSLEEETSRRVYYLIGAAALVVIIVLAFIFLSKPDEPVANAPSAPTAIGSGSPIIQVPPQTESAPLVNPAKTIQTTRSIADQADERVEKMKELEDLENP
jgi:hypothetical protein